MKWLLCCCSLLWWTVAPAQTTGVYTIKPGERILQVIPLTEIFLYPQFLPGTVVFRDGTATAGTMNYNTLLAAIQFIDPKGDTLSLSDVPVIKHILVAKDTFYYSNAFLRLITGNGSVKLAERILFREYVQKPGSYELSSSTTATNTISTLIEKRAYEMSTDQELILKKNIVYYIGDRFNKFLIADKKGVLKLFPKHQAEIRKYIDEQPVDFNKAGDVQRLVVFLQAF